MSTRKPVKTTPARKGSTATGAAKARGSKAAEPRKPKMNAREKADYELLREVSERLFNRAVAPARNPDALKLGMALREARLSTQQGLAEVARKLDLPENWLAQLEEGGIDVKDIYLEDLVRYADALGLDLELTVQSHDGAFCGSVRTADLDKSPAPASADPEPPAK